MFFTSTGGVACSRKVKNEMKKQSDHREGAPFAHSQSAERCPHTHGTQSERSKGAGVKTQSAPDEWRFYQRDSLPKKLKGESHNASAEASSEENWRFLLKENRQFAIFAVFKYIT